MRWNPSDPKMQLQAQSDQKWRIVWEKPTLDSRIAFKFARGAWEKVETDKDFKDIDNRMLPMVDVSALKPGEKPVIELTIENYRKQPELKRVLIEQVPRVGRMGKAAALHTGTQQMISALFTARRTEITVRDPDTAAFIVMSSIEARPPDATTGVEIASASAMVPSQLMPLSMPSRETSV